MSVASRIASRILSRKSALVLVLNLSLVLICSCITGVSFYRTEPAEIDMSAYRRIGIYAFRADPRAPYGELIARIATEELRDNLRRSSTFSVVDLSYPYSGTWWEEAYWDVQRGNTWNAPYEYGPYGIGSRGFGYESGVDAVLFGRVTNIHIQRKVILDDGYNKKHIAIDPFSSRFHTDISLDAYGNMLYPETRYMLEETVAFGLEYVILDRMTHRVLSKRSFPYLRDSVSYDLPLNEFVYFARYNGAADLIEDMVKDAIKGEYKKYTPQKRKIFRRLAENDTVPELEKINEMAKNGELAAAIRWYEMLWSQGYAEGAYNAAICYEAMNNLSSAWDMANQLYRRYPSSEHQELLDRLADAIARENELRRQLNRTRL